MKRSPGKIYLIFLAVILTTPLVVNATMIFESATLGPTDNSGGSTVGFVQYLGVKLKLTTDATVERIGGHFGSSGDSIFGAIVKLDSATDWPDSADLSTPDVLGHTVIQCLPWSPSGSGDVSSALSASLTPGYYALVFGGGLFGTNGGSWAPGVDTSIGDQSYIISNGGYGYPVGSGYGYHQTTEPSRGYRMFIEGQGQGIGIQSPLPPSVPEPSTMLLLGSGLLGLAGLRKKFKK
jgi:hypothetical protein